MRLARLVADFGIVVDLDNPEMVRAGTGILLDEMRTDEPKVLEQPNPSLGVKDIDDRLGEQFQILQCPYCQTVYYAESGHACREGRSGPPTTTGKELRCAPSSDSSAGSTSS